MLEFLLHFFPLLTIFLFALAALNFFRHLASIRAIEKHMESKRPEDWESMGKPSIFSGKFSERNLQFMKFVGDESEGKHGDPVLIDLWERSRQVARQLKTVTWSAFGMYVFTIFAVRMLLNQLAGA